MVKKRLSMGQTYFILDTDNQDIDAEFYCFDDLKLLRDKIYRVLPIANWKLDDLNGTTEYEYLNCLYKSPSAEFIIKIEKSIDSNFYWFQIVVLGGTNPLYEISKLCKVNSWSAFNLEKLEYLDLENLPFIYITEEEKKRNYDVYWGKINEFQEEEEQRKLDLEEQPRLEFNQKPLDHNFYQTEFGKLLLDEINNNRQHFSLTKLINFPYIDYGNVKADINNGKSKVLSFYKYNLLKAIKGKKNMFVHNIAIFIPNLIILISIILSITLKDWAFLLILPSKFLIGKLTTHSNNKQYLKYSLLLILSIALYFFHQNLINSFLVALLIGAITSSVLFARNQFNTAMTNLALINEETFCYLIMKDEIWLKTKDEIYIYSVASRINDIIQKYKT